MKGINVTIRTHATNRSHVTIRLYATPGLGHSRFGSLADPAVADLAPLAAGRWPPGLGHGSLVAQRLPGSLAALGGRVAPWYGPSLLAGPPSWTPDSHQNPEGIIDGY